MEKFYIFVKTTHYVKQQIMDIKSEQILDAIHLDPAVKFKTIMETFQNTKEGESFILHNDHDPKPLYFKLSSTQGDTFTWEYLKQGPEIFDIKIGKKRRSRGKQSDREKQHPKERPFADGILFSKDDPETIRTIVAGDYRKTSVFRDWGIDYGWRGNRSVEEACQANQVSEKKLREALSKVERDFQKVIPSQDYDHWNMSFLADYILETHHKYVKDNKNRIAGLAEEVAEEHGKEFPELIELGKGVRPMIEEFMVHMSKEEDVLFPAIKQMLVLLEKGEKQPGPGGRIANAIAKMEAEHDETREALEYFREITQGYRLPNDVCPEQEQLYKELQMFENDTFLHVHLENNILFPKTVILEEKLRVCHEIT